MADDRGLEVLERMDRRQAAFYRQQGFLEPDELVKMYRKGVSEKGMGLKPSYPLTPAQIREAQRLEREAAEAEAERQAAKQRAENARAMEAYVQRFVTRLQVEADGLGKEIAFVAHRSNNGDLRLPSLRERHKAMKDLLARTDEEVAREVTRAVHEQHYGANKGLVHDLMRAAGGAPIINGWPVAGAGSDEADAAAGDGEEA